MVLNIGLKIVQIKDTALKNYFALTEKRELKWCHRGTILENTALLESRQFLLLGDTTEVQNV